MAYFKGIRMEAVRCSMMSYCPSRIRIGYKSDTLPMYTSTILTPMIIVILNHSHHSDTTSTVDLIYLMSIQITYDLYFCRHLGL